METLFYKIYFVPVVDFILSHEYTQTIFARSKRKKQKSIIERTRNFSKDFFYFEVLKTQEVKY